MPLPNFLIIGAQKTGTSWLAFNLRQHPDVFMPPYEVYYFDKVHNFNIGSAQSACYKTLRDSLTDRVTVSFQIGSQSGYEEMTLANEVG